MRVCKLAAFLAIALLSCSREPRESGGLVLHTISAGIGETTKTQLAAEYTDVLWSVADEVDVWVGETAYEFTSTLENTSSQSSFEGLAPADMGTSWVLVYPKGASTRKSGSVISATLPATQTARADSYDPSAALLYGVSQTTSSTTCKHLYSGIRIMFTETGIKRVSLRGNAGEKIAGDFTFDFSGDAPSISGGTSETIVLNAPGGGTFEKDKWYFILCLPTVFSKGITITADNGTQVGYSTTGTSTTFSRTKIKNKESLTIGNWADIGLAGTVHYGPANTICLRKGAGTTIDVTPSLTTAGWQRCGMETTADAALPNGTEVLWGNSSASLSGTTLTLTAADTEGSSLVAIKKGDTILWSFLVWVTASDPASIDLPSGAKLQEPLGGQLYFQWGRKDPLRAGFPCVENQGYNGLSYSIQYPDKYIDGGGNTSDWLTNDTRYPDDNLWGGSLGTKTVWDPCPEGWRVPTGADLEGLDATYKDKFDKYGLLLPDGTLSDFDWRAYCWTREPYGSSAKSLLMETDGIISITGDARYEGLSVRCVKE
ncbi:MAG: hypothetical protein IJR12_03965 [Bacteroidales bacterium]|nr:hypothetical protein [Bacteroidales bacterium]